MPDILRATMWKCSDPFKNCQCMLVLSSEMFFFCVCVLLNDGNFPLNEALIHAEP